MRARPRRRTHPGATRASPLRARRPQVLAAPLTARASASDATLIARMVLDMCDAHALDETIDRFLATIVARLQAYRAPAR